MEYSSEVVRRFGSLLRAGELRPGMPGLVSGEAEDRTLQVWARFQLQVIDGTIQQVRYRVFGCPHTVAAASWIAEGLEGRPVAAAFDLDVAVVRAALDVPIEKLGKLLRLEDAVRAAVATRT